MEQSKERKIILELTEEQRKKLLDNNIPLKLGQHTRVEISITEVERRGGIQTIIDCD